MGQNGDFIKLAASIPGLKEKIHVDVEKPSEKVYWYIKFNIPLDEKSVSRKTMNVTDREGYILETEISYNNRKHLIVINPLESYAQNEYYFLNISKKVRSEKEHEMKSDVHILFKLKGNEIAEFRILPRNYKVPEPKRRIREMRANDKPIHTKVYSFEKEKNSKYKKKQIKAKKKSERHKDESGISKERLPLTVDFPLNPVFAALGMVLAIISVFIGIAPMIIGCAVIATLGFIHLVYQITRPKFRSVFYYNKGARHFNKENYFRAKVCLNKAIRLNPQNEYAEYALNKVSYYL